MGRVDVVEPRPNIYSSDSEDESMSDEERKAKRLMKAKKLEDSDDEVCQQSALVIVTWGEVWCREEAVVVVQL